MSKGSCCPGSSGGSGGPVIALVVTVGLVAIAVIDAVASIIRELMIMIMVTVGSLSLLGIAVCVLLITRERGITRARAHAVEIEHSPARDPLGRAVIDLPGLASGRGRYGRGWLPAARPALEARPDAGTWRVPGR